jgi:hypothetical protein
VALSIALVAMARPAPAQTVLVRGLPPGAAVDVALNGTPVGSTSANANGDATVPLGQAPGTKPQMDANVYVDTCGERRRVVIVDRSQPEILPEGDCGRQEVPGVFVVRSISTLVISVTGVTPTMLLIQGSYDPDAPPRTWQPLPTGLILSGGTGYTMISDAGLYACGTSEDCNSDGSGLGYTGSVEYWFAPFLAAEASIIKPADVTAAGKGTGYAFDSTLETALFALGGKVGVPAGPMRFYGKVGANYQQSLDTTTQTVEDTVILLDEETGQTVTYEGGSLTLDYRTRGWGWYFGGGAEAWFKSRFALFGEIAWHSLKGEDPDEGEGRLDDNLTVILVGGRLRIF